MQNLCKRMAWQKEAVVRGDQEKFDEGNIRRERNKKKVGKGRKKTAAKMDTFGERSFERNFDVPKTSCSASRTGTSDFLARISSKRMIRYLREKEENKQAVKEEKKKRKEDREIKNSG